MLFETRIYINIRNGEKVLQPAHLQARLLLHLAAHRIFGRLKQIGKPARQIQRPFGRLLPPTRHQNLVPIVFDHRHHGGKRIKIIHKPALQAFFRFLVVDHKSFRATFRAVRKLI